MLAEYWINNKSPGAIVTLPTFKFALNGKGLEGTVMVAVAITVVFFLSSIVTGLDELELIYPVRDAVIGTVIDASPLNVS
jgi:hypothetical protein